MAFNFNWSPLTADASFYTRAQELLTTALNKSPKPPIIVDDIIVNELNLGSVPPELEILEIGDLAEDRFRGIFKMCYTGDAFLTLKTRVQNSVKIADRISLYQANPLNTYLSMKPSFASPQPLAAASGLTIPLQITLSEIKLSAFIILVFSRQKGLTLVFRNDPLESLKVSSTFDSIPFVREYLQKEIEGQLRVLLMEEVPAIIHRLSLRLWVPEYGAKEDEELLQGMKKSTTEERVVDPFASAPQDPLISADGALDSPQATALSIDSGSEYSSFSQKNMLRLAALTDSHRTLSLFTPSIRDAVFRAWAGPTERGETSGLSNPLPTPAVPSFSRMHSYANAGSTNCTFSETSHNNARPTLSTFSSTASGLSLGANRHLKPHAGRKRKHRVVNLRGTKVDGDDSVSVSDGSTMSTAASSAASEIGDWPVLDERHLQPASPPRSPSNRLTSRSTPNNTGCDNTPKQRRPVTPSRQPQLSSPCKQELSDFDSIKTPDSLASKRPLARRPAPFVHQTYRPHPDLPTSQASPRERADSDTSIFTRRTGQSSISSLPLLESTASGIVERAWLMKMAGEIARRVQDENSANGNLWEKADREDLSPPPPAYGM